MESKRTQIVFSLLIVGLLSSTTSARRLGGYEPIKDPRAPEVVEIAKFAINVHNLATSSNLVFVKVLRGQEQVVHGINYKLQIVDGINYKLQIVAKSGNANANANRGDGDKDVYEAIVNDCPSGRCLSLVSFRTIN